MVGPSLSDRTASKGEGFAAVLGRETIMTEKKDLKTIIRERMAKTSESYTTARLHVLREQRRWLPRPMTRFIAAHEAQASSAEPWNDADSTAKADLSEPLEAAVLKVNQLSARVRLLSTGEKITFRASGFWEIVPGQIVTLTPKKRWTNRGFAYASGVVTDARIDVPALGLVPLRLKDKGMMSPGEIGEPEHHPPLKKLWSQISKPRTAYEMDQVLPGSDPDDFDSDPIIGASERNQIGDGAGAKKALMDLLAQDLRCLDAHAHLGNFILDRNPKQALLHYEVGVRIGEQALGAGFTALLPWGHIDNRPFLRCLHGYGLALWRLRRIKEAEMVFERMLWLNPNDNQGARFCWLDAKKGKSWTAVEEQEMQAYH